MINIPISNSAAVRQVAEQVSPHILVPISRRVWTVGHPRFNALKLGQFPECMQEIGSQTRSMKSEICLVADGTAA